VRLTPRIFLIGSGEPDWATTDPLDAQVYLVTTDAGHVVVDAGAGRSVESMVAAARADGLDPARIAWVLLTHGHADHAGGAVAWQRAVPGARVAASAEVGSWLAAADETATSVDRGRAAGIYPADYRLEPCEPALVLGDGDVLPVGDLAFRTVTTPGHAQGHLAFLVDLDGASTLFSGDALFPTGRILLQDTWDCDLHDALRSVERLAALRPERLLAGHLGPVLTDAGRHIETATARISRLLVPESIA
jgi:glyoxylase-like metal-dependent hydrolase (beta-lactamase superfamily II)